jgi:alpha-L-rhamnosidase
MARTSRGGRQLLPSISLKVLDGLRRIWRDNVIAALLGAGWYAGRIGLFQARQIYGRVPQLLLRLDAELADGRTETVVSDASWRRAPESPFIAADLLDGEVYDARKEPAGWDSAGFSDRRWPAVSAEADLGSSALVFQRNEPLRAVRELRPVAITQPVPGVWVFDLGQNVVGWCRLKISARPGQSITIRYAEMLNDNGTIYTANLRGAMATDRYVARSAGQEVYEPRLTYHGFRYIEVRGLAERPSGNALVARVIHSAAPETGVFETSSPYVNQLMSNIVWTQRANLFSIPTDCPQRDERLGWMGDIQAFAQTAIFNMDMAAFLTKWLQDVRDDQLPDGRFPDFAPNPNSVLKREEFFGAPAWGDAGTVVPWRMYENYADRRLLAEHFEAARRWVDFIAHKNPSLLWENARGNDYNDWLNADTLIFEGWPKSGGAIPKAVFATAFFAHSTDIVAKMAAALGRRQDTEHYRELFNHINTEFNRAYVKQDGEIQGDTQAGYALALHFNLLPDEFRAKAFTRILDGFARYRGHLSTGIQSTHRLLLALTRGGRSDEAYRLLNLRTFPSWGFMLASGATTIWERWDGYVKGRGFQNPEMNSFNHWALGSVGEWMWRTIAGINPDEQSPGFQHFYIQPQPGGGLTWARSEYESIRGRIVSDWRIERGLIRLRVVVPPNTSATVSVPTAHAEAVRESSRIPREAPGVRELEPAAGAAHFRIDSGEYVFTAPFR